MLQFPYLDEPLTGPPPPSLAAGAVVRYRPLIPVTVVGPAGQRRFSRAVVDSGGDDTIFPMGVLALIGAAPRPDTGHRIRWRGNLHPLRFADVDLMFADDAASCRWPSVIAFSPAPLPYPILGNAGCLEFFDVRLLGGDLVVELTAAAAIGSPRHLAGADRTDLEIYPTPLPRAASSPAVDESDTRPIRA